MLSFRIPTFEEQKASLAQQIPWTGSQQRRVWKWELRSAYFFHDNGRPFEQFDSFIILSCRAPN
jgi:hypothetical protein